MSDETRGGYTDDPLTPGERWVAEGLADGRLEPDWDDPSRLSQWRYEGKALEPEQAQWVALLKNNPPRWSLVVEEAKAILGRSKAAALARMDQIKARMRDIEGEQA